MGPIIIVIIRLLGPLLILRRPLIGSVLAMLLDSLDFYILSHLGWGFLLGPGLEYHYLNTHLDKYQLLDKLLDTYYLTLQVYTVRLWQDGGARALAYALFTWRVIGVAVFLFVPFEYLLLIFPNIFENVFLLCVLFRQNTRLEPAKMLVIMSVAVIQKLLQEYALHLIPTNYPAFVKGLLTWYKLK